MKPQTLIYIAGSVGLIALAVGGWFFYQTIGFGVVPSTENTGESSQLIFGNTQTNSTAPNEVVKQISVEATSSIPIFGKIVSEPVAGYMLYSDPKAGVVLIYTERGTGFVYSISLDSGVKSRLSNTTIPKTVESVFVSTTTVVVRYETEEGVQTLLGGIKSDKTLSGTILASDIRQVVTDPTSQSIFYLREVGGGVRGYIVKPKQNPKEIFSSPLREWSASFLSKDKVLLVSSASSQATGRSILLDTSKGSEEVILSGLFGLGVLGDSGGTRFFYSESSGGTFVSTVLDSKRGTTTPSMLNTLSDKCGWGTGSKADVLFCAIPLAPNSGSYPDDWYMGLVHFSDDLWSFNAKSGQYKLLASPRKEAGQSLDAIALSVSSDGQYLIFINKNDLSLWSLRLKN